MSDRPSRQSGDSSDASDPFDALLKRAAQLTPLPRGETPRLLPGVEIWNGRFQVLRRIGAGGMGVVHEAIDRVRGERVALKTLSQLDANGIYRLKHEFRALAEVVHPNLVHLHDLFAGDDLWMFTMELVAGAPLDRWVRPLGTLDELRLRRALAQIVAGVSMIHAAGKLHRDLKPSNVLVTPEQRVVILDFGLVADPEPGGAGQTLDDDRGSGTPAYMAPEQAAGEAATAASDWYAVGVMLFEALTGALPFSGGAQTLMQRKQAELAPRPSELARNVPEDLDALCAALLVRDPALRADGTTIAALLLDDAALQPDGGASAPHSAPRKPNALDLIGRDTELASLREAFKLASAGRAAVISVTGESGAGKSSLVTAFLDELRASEQAVILDGRCYEREFVPYKAFDRVVDALTRYLRQLRDVDAASLMPRDIGALARIFPVLDRVEVVAALPARPSADQQELRRRAFDAFAELLGRLRDRHMLVVHIDDAHWIDDDSIRLLEHLVSRPEPVPAMIIVSQRRAIGDGLLDRLMRAAHAGRSLLFRDLALQPLSREATRELARRRLSDVPDCERLAEAVAAESQGSPFFAIELSRHALESKTPEERMASVSLEQALRARTQQLGGSAREVLELLAVAARPTPLDVLALASGSGAGKTDASDTGQAAQATEPPQRTLDALRSAQLVRDAGAGTYECYHDRVRVALIEDVSPQCARASRSACEGVGDARGRRSRGAVRALPRFRAAHAGGRSRGARGRESGRQPGVRAQRDVPRARDRALAAIRGAAARAARAARRSALAVWPLERSGRGVRGGRARVERSDRTLGAAQALGAALARLWSRSGRPAAFARGIRRVGIAVAAHALGRAARRYGALARLVVARGAASGLGCNARAGTCARIQSNDASERAAARSRKPGVAVRRAPRLVLRRCVCVARAERR